MQTAAPAPPRGAAVRTNLTARAALQPQRRAGDVRETRPEALRVLNEHLDWVGLVRGKRLGRRQFPRTRVWRILPGTPSAFHCGNALWRETPHRAVKRL